MLAFFVVSIVELLLIVASLGVFVVMVGFVASLIRPQHSTTRHHFRAGGMLFAMIAVGGVLLYFLGARRDAPQAAIVATPAPRAEEAPRATSMASMTYTAGGASAQISIAPQPAAPSLEALWDRLTKSKINLDGEANEPAADPADEKVKDAVKDTFGLDNEGKLPPQWVITPPKRVGQVLRESIASDPFVTEDECRRQLEQEQLPHSVARQIGYLASAKAGHAVIIDDPLSVGIGLDFIFREICRDEFTGTVDSSVGEMKKVHVLLEYNPAVDKQLLEAWLRHERQNRFASVSKVAALSLTGLAAIYGLLRFDTWSKGYYSRQLLVGGTLAIIAMVVFLLRVS